MHMVYLAVRAMLCAVAALASTSALAADCGADADEVNAKCYPTLQAAVNAALSTDRPLVLPRGTYKGPLVIDYTAHSGTGFELISRGATIYGGLTVQCQRDCFYFHQEGTLFVSGKSSDYLVKIGKSDFSDPQNSIKIDHLVVNNGGEGGAVQLNYVLNGDMFIVADSAGSVGLALEQVQFSTLRGAASGGSGTALLIENGYSFAVVNTGLDLESSPVCVTLTSPHAHAFTDLGLYANCPTGMKATKAGIESFYQDSVGLGDATATPFRLYQMD
jgi:hypothetical protein